MSHREIAYFDDELANINLMADQLSGEFSVNGFLNSMEFETALQQKNFSAILIDFYLPIIDGPDLYHSIKASPFYNGCPIFFISSDHSHEVKIRTLNIGAEDFFNRNMKTEELLLRLKNRVKVHESLKKVDRLGSLTINWDKIACTINTNLIELTLSEFKILKTLMNIFPEVMTREALVKEVWPETNVVSPSTLNTHISNLRLKVTGWDYDILGVKGVGYHIEKK